MEDKQDKTSPKLARDENGRLIGGQESLNPLGRPKGSISIKDKVRQYLESHPDEVEKIVEHFVKTNRELMWQMLEGRPYQDIVSGGEKLPTPILNVFTNHSDNQDKPNDQKDPGGSGGNISE